MGNNPSYFYFKGPKNPVEQVSWDDCQQFLDKLNKQQGNAAGKFVLPTEAQWEYACRAGSKARYCFGDDETQLGEYAWYNFHSDEQTWPVGQKKPNAWGLYDMHGNVWEWCQDWFDDKGQYYKDSPVNDPSGPTAGSLRVYRDRQRDRSSATTMLLQN
jgi:formylglycine-generating enzyme required for sulfatase activity